MSEHTVSTTSLLPLPAAAVADLLGRPETVRWACWPLLTFSGELPPAFEVGATVEVRIRALGLGPAWRHRITVVSVDDGGAVTEESGGPIRRWRHRLTVEPVDAGSAFYRDEVLLDAGALTPVAVPVVRGLYRWRHRRWRRLAARLGGR